MMNRLLILLRIFKKRIHKQEPPGSLINTFTVLSLIGFLLVVFLIAIIFLKRYKKEVREKTGVVVQSVLESTHQAIKHIWLERYFDYAKIWASDRPSWGCLHKKESIVSLEFNLIYT